MSEEETKDQEVDISKTKTFEENGKTYKKTFNEAGDSLGCVEVKATDEKTSEDAGTGDDGAEDDGAEDDGAEDTDTEDKTE